MEVIYFNSNNNTGNLCAIAELLITAKEMGYTHAHDECDIISEIFPCPIYIDEAIDIYSPLDFECSWEGLDEATRIDLQIAQMLDSTFPTKVMEKRRIPSDVPKAIKSLLRAITPPSSVILYYEEGYTEVLVKHNFRTDEIIAKYKYHIN